MSNIKLTQEKIGLLNNTIDNLSIDTLNNNDLNKILNLLVPNNINYIITDRTNNTAIFYPSSKNIILNIKNLQNWIYNESKYLNDSNIDSELFNKYLLLFVLVHEIEHSYQYLISKNIVNTESNMLSHAYSELFDLLKKKHYYYPALVTCTRRIISKYLYQKNQNFYLLERNANVESTDFVRTLALLNDREDIYNVFNSLNHEFLKIGYLESNIGSIEETFKNIFMYDKYLKFKEEINMTSNNASWYGFNIPDYEREYILRK